MSGVRGRVLVVDDNVDLADLLADLLVAEGLRCDVAADAIVARRLLAGSPPPDLVLLDLTLPRGNGRDVLRLLSESRFNDTRVVLMSDHAPAELERTRETLPRVEILTKPFPAERLLALASEVRRRCERRG